MKENKRRDKDWKRLKIGNSEGIFFKKLVVTELVKKYPIFVEPKDSLLYLQRPFLVICSKPVQSTLFS
jgi:hypothetical protein